MVVESVGWGVPSDARDHGFSEGYGSTRQTKRSRRLGRQRLGSDEKEVEEVGSRRSGSERTKERSRRSGVGKQGSRMKRPRRPGNEKARRRGGREGWRLEVGSRTKRLGSRRTEVRGPMKRRSTRPGSEKVE